MKIYKSKPSTPKSTSQSKAFDHERQRREFAADIVQPYNADGSVSDDFLWLYPEQADMYRRNNGGR